MAVRAGVVEEGGQAQGSFRGVALGCSGGFAHLGGSLPPQNGELNLKLLERER